MRVLAHGEIARRAGRGRRRRPGSFLLQVVEARWPAASGSSMSCRWPRCWSPSGSELRQTLLPVTLAELRQFRREGALVDALSQDGFALALARSDRAAGRDRRCAGDRRRAAARSVPPDAAIRRCPTPERLVVRRLGAEQSNSSVLFEEYAVLKIYRRVQPGLHPEIEMGRFLVERAGFANTPPLLATIEMAAGRRGDGAPATRSACCSASCATRATAGRGARTTSRAISTTR